MSTPSPLTEEDLKVLKVKYLNVRRLLKKNDPETEPYKSCYEARDLLYELEKLLVERTADSEGPTREKYMLTIVRMLIGEISLHTQELDLSRQYLKKSRKSVKGDEPNPENILCTLYTLNQLGLLFSTVEKIEKTLKYLAEAEKLYKDYVASTDGSYVSFNELFTGKPDPEESLEKTHTHTLYYIAQAYKIDNRPVPATQYCHITLRRQLLSLEKDKRIEWVLNASALSQVFVEHYMFPEAHHHLCAASYILDLRKADLDAVSDEEQRKADLEEFRHRSGDVAMCWVKYDLMLLKISQERLLTEGEERQKLTQYPKELVGLKFPNLDLAKYEKVVTTDFLLTYDDARLVFLHGQECVKKAKEYYTLEEHASDYIKIQRDVSRLYNRLQFFEEDEGRRCKMMKRRADILSEVLNDVCQTHYMLPCREINLELGEIYTLMFDSKSSQMPAVREEHHLTKLVKLLNLGICSYQNFIDSFKDKRTGTLPEFVDEENERRYLFAHVYTGRLSHKLWNIVHYTSEADNTVREHLERSLYHYKYVVDYVYRRKEKVGNDGPIALSDAEIEVCEQMIQLIPLITQKNEAK